MATRLLLVRHGEAACRDRFLQHTCTGLSDLGRQQAKRLGRRLVADEGLKVDAVLASRAARALETAKIIAEALCLDVAESTCDLCELHPGAAEGMTYEQMKARWGPSYCDVPDAEYDDWIPRIRTSLMRLASTYAGQTAVCVTHNGVIKTSFSVLGGLPEPRRTAKNTSITEWWNAVTDESEPTTWRFKRFNDTRHLGVDDLLT